MQVVGPFGQTFKPSSCIIFFKSVITGSRKGNKNKQKPLGKKKLTHNFFDKHAIHSLSLHHPISNGLTLICCDDRRGQLTSTFLMREGEKKNKGGGGGGGKSKPKIPDKVKSLYSKPL